MAFLKLTNISKQAGQTAILSNVSLEFPETGLVFIVGKSGAGKSTLLNVIGQLDCAYEGSVCLDGELCEKTDACMCELRRKKIGFVFQDFNLLGDLSVEENLLLAGKLSQCNAVDVEQLLKAFAIEECRQKPCKVLSGGERQRAALVRAICKESRLILADEPTGNLDQGNTQIVFEALKRMSRERLVLVVTHDTEAASAYADRVIRLADGRVVSDESNQASTVCPSFFETAKETVGTVSGGRMFVPLMRQHLKKNRRRNAMIVTLCVFLTVFSLITTGLLNAMRSVNSSIIAVLGNDKLVVSSDEENGWSLLSEDFLREVKSSGCKDAVAYRQILLGTYRGNDYISLNYWVFHHNDFFEERFHYYDLTLPASADEVIINNHLAKQLFGTSDCIGRELVLYAFGDVQAPCRVSAVSDMMGEESPMLCLSSELLGQIYAKGVTSNELTVCSDSGREYAFVRIQPFSGTDSLVYGRAPSQENELVVNAGGLNSLLQVLELPYAAVSVRDVVDGAVSEELVADILDAAVSIREPSLKCFYPDLQIVGITDGTEDRLILTVNPETYEDMRVGKANTLDIYLRDRTKNKAEVDKILERYQYSAEDRGGFRAASIAARMSVPVVFCGVLAAVSLFLVFLFIRLATKINIMNQVNEIGILKALGAENRQIRQIYLGENLRLYGWAMLITVLILVVLQTIKLAGGMTYNGIAIFEINLGYFGLAVLLGTATVCAATWLEVRKIAKMNPVDMLRKSS